MVLIYDQLYWP